MIWANLAKLELDIENLEAAVASAKADVRSLRRADEYGTGKLGGLSNAQKTAGIASLNTVPVTSAYNTVVATFTANQAV